MSVVQFNPREVFIRDPEHAEFVRLFTELIRELEEVLTTPELGAPQLNCRIAKAATRDLWIGDINWQGEKFPVINHEAGTFVVCSPYGWNPRQCTWEEIFLVFYRRAQKILEKKWDEGKALRELHDKIEEIVQKQFSAFLEGQKKIDPA